MVWCLTVRSSTMLKADQVRLKSILTEAIMLLCKNGLSYETEFCIEGLLGITLDKSEIFLVNIKETINKVVSGMGGVDDPDDAILDLVVREHIETACNDDFLIEDLSLKPARKSLQCYGKNRNDAMDRSRLSNGSLDLSMSDIGNFGHGRGGKDDNLNMIVPEMSAYAKYVDYDPVALLTGVTSRVRDVTDENAALVEDLSMSVSNQVSVFNQDVLQGMMGKDDSMSNESTEGITVSAPDITVKEEHFNAITQHAGKKMNADTLDLSCNVIISADPPESLVIDATVTTNADPILSSGDQDTGAATWEQGEALDMEIDLSLPQDLTVNEKQTKVKPKFGCSQCGKRYKSEQGLKKHKCKGQPAGSNNTTHTGETTQPLDLTICRSDDENMGPDEEPGDLDPSCLVSGDAFTCICSKTLSDYKAYVKHITSCSKSKLTPYKACDICGKYFFSTSGYVKHKRLHVGAYKFRCNVCHKGFFDRTHLGAHMDSSHSKVRRYECPFCQRSFFWKHHLKRHHGTCYKAKEMKCLQLPVQVPGEVEEENEVTVEPSTTVVTSDEPEEMAEPESLDSRSAEPVGEDPLDVSLDLTIS